MCPLCGAWGICEVRSALLEKSHHECESAEHSWQMGQLGKIADEVLIGVSVRGSLPHSGIRERDVLDGTGPACGIAHPRSIDLHSSVDSDRGDRAQTDMNVI